MKPIRHLAAAITLVAALSPTLAAAEALTLTHVHGLAWSADGQRLMIPSHHGLAVFEDDRWSKAPGPQHDYMGFAVTADALYSSGHPARGSALANPFGLIRSNDGGREWNTLGMSGESDFHLLAASYRSNAIHVFNTAPNSRMHAAGVFSTANDGFTWRQRALDGVSGKPSALAAHPDDPQRFALGTSAGVYVTHGDKALRRLADGRITALGFDLSGDALWVGRYGDGPELARVELPDGKPAVIEIPLQREDAVAYIAQNPVRPAEIAIATFRRDVFVSTDAGAHWQAIARDGRGIDRDR